ncbi:hypothetical protein, partial [Caballeronia sp. dw_19]|uniref:hypothetical protein n=1 Tax=Caballeronia sp. dw_19 TaxID=2719791 RepID=UPI001BD456D1
MANRRLAAAATNKGLHLTCTTWIYADLSTGVLTRIEPVLRVINLSNMVACPFTKLQDGLA